MTTTRQPSLIDTIFRLQELADYIVPFGIRAVSELHLADHLTNGPRTITDLATATNTHPPSTESSEPSPAKESSPKPNPTPSPSPHSPTSSAPTTRSPWPTPTR